jgi:hypothetical protein
MITLRGTRQGRWSDLDDWLRAEEEITQQKAGTVAAWSYTEVSVDVGKPGGAAAHD